MEAATRVPMKFKRLKAVVRPQLKLMAGVEVHVKIVGPMHLGKQLKDDKEPATLVDIVNLDTGEEMQIILPKIVREVLAEQYPSDKYIGKCFALELMRVPEKRYNLVKTLVEIEPDEAQVAVPKQPAAAGNGAKK